MATVVIVSGPKLREFRESLVLTQAAMADKIGLSRERLSRIEVKDVSSMRVISFRRLAEALAIDPIKLKRRLSPSDHLTV